MLFHILLMLWHIMRMKLHSLWRLDAGTTPKMLAAARAPANQCINIKNHEKKPEGNSRLLHVVVSLLNKSNLQGKLIFYYDVL